MKKKKKKKRLRVKSVLKILFLVPIIVIIYFISKIPVRNFYVNNNTYLSDEQVLNELKLDKENYITFKVDSEGFRYIKFDIKELELLLNGLLFKNTFNS